MKKEQAINYLVPGAVYSILYYKENMTVTDQTKQILLEQGYTVEQIDANVDRDFIIWADTRPKPTDAEISSAMEIVIPPQIVSMKKFRLTLLHENLLSQVDPAINSLDEPQRSELRIEWDYSTYVDRTESWVTLFAQAMNLSEEQMDNLFILSAEENNIGNVVE
jgi:hypothetical protein